MGLIIIDCWTVHHGKPFLTWMKIEHGRLQLAFVPGGCKLLSLMLQSNGNLLKQALESFSQMMLEFNGFSSTFSRKKAVFILSLIQRNSWLHDTIPAWNLIQKLAHFIMWRLGGRCQLSGIYMKIQRLCNRFIRLALLLTFFIHFFCFLSRPGKIVLQKTGTSHMKALQAKQPDAPYESTSRKIPNLLSQFPFHILMRAPMLSKNIPRTPMVTLLMILQCQLIN